MAHAWNEIYIYTSIINRYLFSKEEVVISKVPRSALSDPRAVSSQVRAGEKEVYLKFKSKDQSRPPARGVQIHLAFDKHAELSNDA